MDGMTAGSSEAGSLWKRHTARSRAEQSRAEQSRAEQSRAVWNRHTTRSRAEQRAGGMGRKQGRVEPYKKKTKKEMKKKVCSSLSLNFNSISTGKKYLPEF